MRLITDILRDIRKGRPVEEATMALADVVRAVDETGKDGSVTITLKIKAAKHGGPEKTLVCEVKAKKPIAEIAPAVFFSDADGDLHRVDPRQEEMPLGEVTSGAPKVDAAARA
jgi:hypothetical protein